MSADLLEFRQPPPLAQPGASPLLAAILLGVALCRDAEQLARWWDWPDHRAAWWRLSAAERAIAVAAKDRATAFLPPQPSSNA